MTESPDSAARRSSLTFSSPVGPLRVSATGDKLIEVRLGAPDLPSSEGEAAAADEVCRLAREEIEAYLRGELETFTVPYRLMGSPFQRSVWKEMARIPYGTTVTYGRLAKRIGDPEASRPVGAACGANPLPLVVPCHRVVAGSGLGGFSGGIERKKWLLDLELLRRPPSPLGEAREDAAEERFAAVEGVQRSLF